MVRAPDEQGRREQAGRAQGGAARLSAARQPEGGRAARSGRRQTPATFPLAGEAWVDAPLLDALGLKIGDTLLLGDAGLRIARVIALEPDRGTGFVNFAPRVMVNEADVAAQPA